MEPPLDPVETELIPNEIVVFEEDLSNWNKVPPEYVGPAEARMMGSRPPMVQPAPAKSSDATPPHPASPKSV